MRSLFIALIFCVIGKSAFACVGAPILTLDSDSVDEVFRDEIALRRLSQIVRDVEFLRSYSSVSSCKVMVLFRLPDVNRVQEYSKPDFSLTRNGVQYVVTAGDSLGFLYGFYEVLDDLGYIFATPTKVLLPRGFTPKSEFASDRIISPAIKVRGLWVFGHNRDPRFLLWAGRNRYNLVGGKYSGNEDYYSIFDIRRWGGGHEVISNLVPSDKIVNGKKLIDLHPEWYGVIGFPLFGKSYNPIPTGAETFRNPCFGDSEFIDYFSEALVGSLINGYYQDVDVLNIWPSDQPTFLRGNGCKPAPGARTDLDDLVYFYNRVVRRLNKDQALKKAGRIIEIAGIGYYGTYDLSGTKHLLPNSVENVSYAHYFYNNVRSYQRGLFDPLSGVNRRLVDMFNNTLSAHQLNKFGVVEYYNYSIYNSMVSPSTSLIGEELRHLKKLGITMWGYMHPEIQPSAFHAALNYNLSRALFNGANPQESIEHFSAAYLGKRSDRKYFDSYEVAIQNLFELMGPESSLRLIQSADRVWKPGLLDADEIVPVSDAILRGKKIQLPVMRLPGWGSTLFDGQSLNDSLMYLQKLDDVLTPQEEAEIYGIRRARMRDEVRRTKRILMMLKDIVLHREAVEAHNTVACRNALMSYLISLEEIENLPFPEKVSDFMSKTTILDSLKAYYDDYLSGSCL